MFNMFGFLLISDVAMRGETYVFIYCDRWSHCQLIVHRSASKNPLYTVCVYIYNIIYIFTFSIQKWGLMSVDHRYFYFGPEIRQNNSPQLVEYSSKHYACPFVLLFWLVIDRSAWQIYYETTFFFSYTDSTPLYSSRHGRDASNSLSVHY